MKDESCGSAYDSASSRAHAPHAGAALKSTSTALCCVLALPSAVSMSLFHDTAIVLLLKLKPSNRCIGCIATLCGRYFAFSCKLLEIAVTNFLGLNRTDIAVVLLRTPGITSPFPAIIPLYPARATSFDFIAASLNSRDSSMLARPAKLVAVAPGQRQVTVIPLPFNSLAIASENMIT